MSSYHELFPPCTKEGCTEHPDEDQHVLPHQVDTIESEEKYVVSIGGYGSGKTLGNAVLGHLLSVAIPGNLGFVGRRTLPKLHDSTERIFLEVLQRADVNFEGRENRDGWPHRIIYPNGSEIVFRPTQDLGRFLGPEYGWFYVDEAQEEPEGTFTRLAGRLRLPRAASYLKGLLSSNPPHKTHWLARRFPKPGTWETREEVNGEMIITKWRMIRTSTLENPFLDPGYIANLKTLHSASEVKRILQGFYGFEQEGRPVYGNFVFEKNVGIIQPQLMTLARSWDFGYHAPVVTWHQFPRCKKGRVHWIILHELVPRDIEAEPLAEMVIKETSERFKNWPRHFIMDCGDTAGAQMSDRGPGPIIRLGKEPYKLTFRHTKFKDIDPSIALVRKCLGTMCECGFPVLTVDRNCTEVIDMFAGGYHFPDESKIGGRNKGTIVDKPVKDGYFDNIADSVRYAGWNLYRPAAVDPHFLDILIGDNRDKGMSVGSMPNSWDWMERI